MDPGLREDNAVRATQILANSAPPPARCFVCGGRGMGGWTVDNAGLALSQCPNCGVTDWASRRILLDRIRRAGQAVPAEHR